MGGGGGDVRDSNLSNHRVPTSVCLVWMANAYLPCFCPSAWMSFSEGCLLSFDASLSALRRFRWKVPPELPLMMMVMVVVVFTGAALLLMSQCRCLFSEAVVDLGARRRRRGSNGCDCCRALQDLRATRTHTPTDPRSLSDFTALRNSPSHHICTFN